MKNIDDLIVRIQGNSLVIKYNLDEFFADKYMTNDAFFDIVNQYIQRENKTLKSFVFVNEL